MVAEFGELVKRHLLLGHDNLEGIIFAQLLPGTAPEKFKLLHRLILVGRGVFADRVEGQLELLYGFL